MTLSIWFQ